MGGVTIVGNVPGVDSGKLKLDGPTAADIFRGAIRKWNDPLIVSQNPGLKLPDLAITVAFRSDGSGTTYVFSNYLARQSVSFRNEVGTGNTVNWPANGVGGRKQDDAAARKWLELAARQGFDTAELDLGTWLVQGRGGPRDNKGGFKWLLRAAMGGNVAAQNRIAKLYVEGIGIDPDVIVGTAWYIIAKRAGLADPAQASLVSSSALMGWIVVVQLVTITLGIAATGWLLRRWGPHRMKGMASPAEAERLLGLRRLRKVATVVRPDLYAATPKGDHHDGYHPTR